MVPLTLLVLLSAELTAYATTARFLFDAPWDTAAFAAVGALLGIRASIVAVTWTFAAAHQSPAPPLTAGQRLRMIVGEYLAFLITFVVVLPFERLWMPRDRLGPCPRPLVLVHGYGCSRGVWWWLRRRLEVAGHTVASVSLAPPYTSIGKLVPQLARRIEEVRRATGAGKVVLVAHSMGGLVCRSYLARYGSESVERLVTLASPHAGSELARLGIGQNAREMEPNSLWLRDLTHEVLPVPAVSIRTPHDNYVMPQDSQRLPGAGDVELAGFGHLAVLYARPAAAELLKACSAGQ
jgi:triacylglycerol lipase